MDSQRLTSDQLRMLSEALLHTHPRELTCDEWVDHVAGYMEAKLAGQSLPASAELVEQHISLCPECREEYNALLTALEGETNRSP